MEKIIAVLKDLSANEQSREIFIGILLTIIAIVVYLLLLRLSSRLLGRVHATLDSWRDTRIPPLRVQSFEMISSDQMTRLFQIIHKITNVL